MWISRNTQDYSEKYGPALDRHIRESVRLVFECVNFVRRLCGLVLVEKMQVNAHTCILDGEMCAWSDTEKRFIPFGNNRTVATEELEIGQPTRWLMYVVFDILYLSGGDAEDVLNRHVN